MTGPIRLPMEEIEQLAADARLRRDQLNKHCNILQDSIQEIMRQAAPAIQRESEIIPTIEQQIADLVEANQSLFAKPKTRVLHGFKIGLRKKPGKITWKKAANVVARIKKQMSILDAAKLIRSEEVPDKEALEKLPTKTLRALGISVIDAGDVVVVNPTDTDLDKMVKGFMDAAQTAVEDQAA